jgi:hypothetical protein
LFRGYPDLAAGWPFLAEHWRVPLIASYRGRRAVANGESDGEAIEEQR